MFILYILPCHKLPPSSEGTGSEGTQLSDAVYLTLDLLLEAGTWISKICSPGDHCSCIIEIQWKALVGEDMVKIVVLMPIICLLPLII